MQFPQTPCGLSAIAKLSRRLYIMLYYNGMWVTRMFCWEPVTGFAPTSRALCTSRGVSYIPLTWCFVIWVTAQLDCCRCLQRFIVTKAVSSQGLVYTKSLQGNGLDGFLQVGAHNGPIPCLATELGGQLGPDDLAPVLIRLPYHRSLVTLSLTLYLALPQ